MVKSRKKLFLVLSLVLVLAMCMSLLVACNGGDSAKEYNVTFMVKENGNGAWKEVTTVKSNADGVVVLPKNPVVPGYSFRAWYTDEACQNKFDGTGVTKDMKVYAFLSDKLVNVKIKGADGTVVETKNQTVAGLNTLEEAEIAKAKAANLTFDGFYTNEGYTIKFDINSEAKDIYARYAAKVEFYNGYENLDEKLINPGEKVAAPKVADIKKVYMDAEDISFVSNADRKTAFDFNAAINTNTVVRINWRTPNLDYKVVQGTDMVFVDGINWSGLDKETISTIEAFQVVSIPNHVVIDDIDYTVEGVSITAEATKALKKIIIQEGIDYVADINVLFEADSKLEDVELPTTLKYLESSFNNLPEVAKNIVLPEGLLAVYNSFWNDYAQGHVSAERKSGYDFSITIPASVKNIVSVPNNLTYANGSTFYNEGNFTMNNDPEFGKTIVGIMQSAVVNNNLVIPEGIEALQVGVFDGINCEYINLPKSFTKVAYNLEKSENPTYVDTYTRMSIRSAVNTPDANPSESGMTILGYALIPDLNDYTYVTMNCAEYPANMNKFAFSDWVKVEGEIGSVLAPFDQLEKTTLVFVGDKLAGENVKITVKTTNTMINSVQETIINSYKSGEGLTKEDLLKQAALTEADLGYKFKITGIKQFGSDYDFTEGIKHNLYLDITYEFDATGVTTEEDADGNLVVTGFDQATAQDLKTNADPSLSTYLIVIPNELNGKKIVAIKDSAFENNKMVAKVYVGNSIKVIGKKAFKNAKNLESFIVTKGGLEIVGEEAFKYAGAIQDEDGKWIANPQLAKVSEYEDRASLFMQIPLSNLKDIEPEAFNTPAIRSFSSVEEEEGRAFVNNIFAMGEFIEGEFYYYMGNNFPAAIIKYVGSEAKVVNKADATKDIFEFYTTAGGYFEEESISFGSMNGFVGNNVWSAIVKKGSIHLYYYGRCGLFFTLVDKVETGAVVYLDPLYFEDHADGNGLVVMNPNDPRRDCWMKKDVFTSQADAKYVEGNIFEDGWYMGQDNTLNTFVDKVSVGTGTVPGM